MFTQVGYGAGLIFDYDFTQMKRSGGRQFDPAREHSLFAFY